MDDPALARFHHLLTEYLLDAIFRVERLEHLAGIRNEPITLDRMPELTSLADADAALTALQLRLDALEPFKTEGNN